MVSLISHVSIDFSSIGAVMLVDDAQWQGVLSPLPFLFASQKKDVKILRSDLPSFVYH